MTGTSPARRPSLKCRLKSSKDCCTTCPGVELNARRENVEPVVVLDFLKYVYSEVAPEKEAAVLALTPLAKKYRSAPAGRVMWSDSEAGTDHLACCSTYSRSRSTRRIWPRAFSPSSTTNCSPMSYLSPTTFLSTATSGSSPPDVRADLCPKAYLEPHAREGIGFTGI